MEETRNRNLPNIKLANRQVDVIRRNLVSVCRFAIKNLIDRASFVNIDDDCEEFVNFCAVMEQVLLHRIKPQKTWYGGTDTHFWGYIATSCRRVPNSCITSIGAIENIKSPAAKGRAFIRCALMEKRLSEYISAALKQSKITRKFYMEGAIMLSDDSSLLCDVLLGLNAIDFSFCLKGENTDLLGPLAVDYTPFLKFHQSHESLSHDLEEMRELSNSSLSSSIMSEDVDEMTTLKIKLNAIQQKYRSIVEQKGYLEELVRLRDHQIKECQSQHQSLVDKLHHTEVIGQQEHQQLETVILELQGQLAAAKSEHQLLQQRLSLMMIQRQTNTHTENVRDIQMVEMAGEMDSLNRHFMDSLNDRHSITSSTDMQHHVYLQTDNGSMMSDASFHTQADSHSLIPLSGSLTEVPIHTDSDLVGDGKQFPMVSVESLSDSLTKTELDSSRVIDDGHAGIAETVSDVPAKVEFNSSHTTPSSDTRSDESKLIVGYTATTANPENKIESDSSMTVADTASTSNTENKIESDSSMTVADTATTANPENKIESDSSMTVADTATTSNTENKIESDSSMTVADTATTSNTENKIESDSSMTAGGDQHSGVTAEDDEGDVSDDSADDSLMVNIEDSSDMQVRGSVNQYYSITTVDEMDHNDDDVDGDDGIKEDKTQSKDIENKKMYEDQKQSGVNIVSDKTDDLELEQLPEKECKDLLSTASEGQELEKHDIEENTEEKAEVKLENEGKNASTSEVDVASKEMEKSSSSEGSEPPHTQRLEESNSSDDKDPWEMIAKESGSGNDKSSDDNIEKVDVSPEVSVSDELSHGDDIEGISNVQDKGVESIPDGDNIPKQSDTDQ